MQQHYTQKQDWSNAIAIKDKVRRLLSFFSAVEPVAVTYSQNLYTHNHRIMMKFCTKKIWNRHFRQSVLPDIRPIADIKSHKNN